MEEQQAFPPYEDDEEQGSRFNKRLLIGIAVVVLTTAYLIFLSLDAASAVYFNVDEIAASNIDTDRRVRVGGIVSPGTIARGDDALDITFTVHGDEMTLPVQYRGVPPDIFGDNAVVFIEGYYLDNGVFSADVLLTRHPDTMEALPEGATAPNYRSDY